MKYIVDGKQMKEIDRYTIQEIGIPSMVLMERAALTVVHIMKQHITKKDFILCVCGTGNNGGDGVAIARMLFQEGYRVSIFFLGEKEMATQETKLQLKIARELNIDILNHVETSEYNIIVDAIFGIGLSRFIKEPFKTVIQQINQVDGLVFSVDIPSGIHADYGTVMDIAVKADYTITFGFNKQGLLLYPGAECAGTVIVTDIGFPRKAAEHTKLTTFSYEAEDVTMLPKRPRYSNKGTFGKVLVIAGSQNMSGACFLSAKAAYRSGAGLVKILTVEENREILQTTIPEAVLITYHSLQFENTLDRIITEIKQATAIVIGPGMGTGKEAQQLLDLVLQYAKCSVVIDADGLNLLSANRAYVHKSKEDDVRNTFYVSDNVILTPHLKEMSRLLDCQISDITEDIIKTAKDSLATAAVLVLKDARTIITDGEKVYVNVSGNPGMATAGAGDVLTGVIAAFAAQGLSNLEAAAMGTYIHGLSGDIAAKEKGYYSLMSHDIIDAIHKAIKQCE